MLWSEHEIQGSNSWPLTVTLTLSRHAWVMSSADRLTKANIWPKFHKNLSKGSGDMERTRKGRMTLTLSLHRWVIGSTHHLTKANIWTKFNKTVWMEWSGLKIQGSNLTPSTVTLILSQHSWVMSSAHHLTEANNWPTFKENPSRGKGDMEPTPNSRLKLVTFNCDLDLKSTGLSYEFCTLSYWGEHSTIV